MSESAPKSMSSVGSDEVRKTIGATRAPRSRAVRVLRTVLWAALLLGLGAAGTQLFRGAAAVPGPVFQTTEAKRGDVRVIVTANGALEATTTVEVGAEVTGRVLEVKVDANDLVKKGQVLATIDPEQLRAAVQQATAQVGSAEASIRLASATATETNLTLARVRLQVGEGLATARDLEAADAAAERAAANVDAAVASATLARATLSQARSRLDKTTILSPIDGHRPRAARRAGPDGDRRLHDAGALQARRGPHADDASTSTSTRPTSGACARDRRRPSRSTRTRSAPSPRRSVAAQRAEDLAERRHLRGRALGRQRRAAPASGHDGTATIMSRRRSRRAARAERRAPLRAADSHGGRLSRLRPRRWPAVEPNRRETQRVWILRKGMTLEPVLGAGRRDRRHRHRDRRRRAAAGTRR